MPWIFLEAGGIKAQWILKEPLARERSDLGTREITSSQFPRPQGPPLQSQPRPADSMDATPGRQQGSEDWTSLSQQKKPLGMSCLPWLHQLWAPPAWPWFEADCLVTLRLSWETATGTPLRKKLTRWRRGTWRGLSGLKGRSASLTPVFS